MSLRSPLGRALGRGSAKQGVSQWWTERLSAAALVPLSLWFLIGLFSLGSLEYVVVREWLAVPFNTLLTLLLVATLVWHSSLGVQVVIEDYVHQPGLKLFCLLLVRFAHAVLGVAGIYAVLMIAFASSSGNPP